mgnify:CR=1 FL=1
MNDNKRDNNESFEEKYVSVPEQSSGSLIPEGICNPGQVYTIGQGGNGMIGVFRLEVQAMPGNGKFQRTGLGTEKGAKAASDTAFNYLKANGSRISSQIQVMNKDFMMNYQDMQGIGMTEKLGLATLISICSVTINRPVLGSLVILGDFTIGGTITKLDNLADTLQVCLDSGAKKILLPMSSTADFGTVPSDLLGKFNLMFYQSPEDAVYKALGVE